MLSWIFRNRLRLRTIYGHPDAPSLPGARFAPDPDEPAPPRLPGQISHRPGEVWRTQRHLMVRPMPSRVA